MKKLILAFFAAAASCCFGGFSFYVDGTISGYTGNAINADTPVLIRVGDAKISGFYSAIKNNGADIKFTSADGTVVYPHEVDTWNPSGESLIWVKLPRLENGVQFRMYYGDATEDTPPSSAGVWTGYHGVWHFNTDLKDSGANGYDGTDFNTVGSTAGAVGTGWTISNSETPGDRVGAIACLSSTNLLHGSVFTWSGWIKTTSNVGSEYMNVIAKRPLNNWKNSPTECDGGFEYYWNCEWGPGGHGFYASCGHGRGGVNCYAGNGKNSSDLLNYGDWRFVVITVSGLTFQSYLNGNKIYTGTPQNFTTAFSDLTAYPLVFGNESSTDFTKIGTAELPTDSSSGTTWQGHGSAWKGSLDEYRLHQGVRSDDDIMAEYLVSTTDVSSFGTPEPIASVVVKPNGIRIY